MFIKDILNRANSKWMEGTGPESDVVISCRVRLARNLAGVPCPHLLNEEQGRQVVKRVVDAIAHKEVEKIVGHLEAVALSELSALDRQILVEKHLISPQHAEAATQSRAVVLREDEAVSILVNEEDHLRIQCLFPGFQLNVAWDLANRVDDVLEKRLDFAFDEKYGYLTACPTNVGTGMRASVMMHLPGLVITNQANRVLSALSQLGLAVRGLYGEGTEAAGNLFQISNQITLGLTEEEIINNLTAVTHKILEQERMARELLRTQTKEQLEDRVGRAFGILTNARIITSQEAISYLSDVRLGADLGIIRGVDTRILNELIVLTRPNFLQKLAGHEMSPFARDLKRASIIREKLAPSKG
ncbi:MAG: protein arginine kinase [Firmicutes bacterium]|nr:protein arginine kinase [Bacillota bacterium]